MARIASGVLVAALLALTVAVAVFTEKLKLTPSPISGTLVDRTFSPVCDCPTDHATVAFRLRRGDVVSAEIIDRHGAVVRTLLDASTRPRGLMRFVWDGRDGRGALVAEGVYRPRIRLHAQRRTITLPNPISLDLTRPSVVAFSVHPAAFSPDGDGRGEALAVRYRLSERAQVSLYVDGRRVVLRRGTAAEGRLRWQGTIDDHLARRGEHALTLQAVDPAGNVSAQSRPLPVVVRYVALGRSRVAAVPGAWFAILVGADARSVAWEFRGRRGQTAPGTLRLRAPAEPGAYPLVVRVGAHTARAVISVREVAR